jgi:hypothetical protein
MRFDPAFHTKYLNLPIETLSINSYNAYLDYCFEYQTIPKPHNVTFNKNFDPDLDLWGFRFLSQKTYISDRLLKAMQVAKITGFRAISPDKARYTAKMTGNPYTELIFDF